MTTRIRIIASALLLFGLSTFAWPQKTDERQITLTLVRWPYT